MGIVQYIMMVFTLGTLVQGDEKALESKTEAFRKEMSYWEQYLTASKYIAGDEFTLADIALVPQCLFFERQGASFSDYPKLKAYLSENKVRHPVSTVHAPCTPGLMGRLSAGADWQHVPGLSSPFGTMI